MGDHKHKVMYIGDNTAKTERVANILKKAGKEPVIFDSPTTAYSYLNSTDQEKKYQKHRDISMIFSENDFKDHSKMSGLKEILLWRDFLESDIPVVSLCKNPYEHDYASRLINQSGTDLENFLPISDPNLLDEKEYLFHENSKVFLNMNDENGITNRFFGESGFLTKKATPLEMVVTNTLFEKIDNPFTTKIGKAGGSSDDIVKLLALLSFKDLGHNLLNFYSSNPNVHLILFSGSGDIGDGIKRDKSIYPDLKKIYNNLMHKGLEINLMKLQALMGDNAKLYTPNTLFKSHENIYDLFFDNPIILLSTAPRHLRMNHPDVTEGSDTYPNLAISSSDGVCTEIASMFGSDMIYFKDAPDICSDDPNAYFKNGRWDLDSLRRSSTRPLKMVSYKEMKDGITKNGTPIIRKAYDRYKDYADEHLSDIEGLMLSIEKEIKRTIIYPISITKFYPNGSYIFDKSDKLWQRIENNPFFEKEEMKKKRTEFEIRGYIDSVFQLYALHKFVNEEEFDRGVIYHSNHPPKDLRK